LLRTVLDGHLPDGWADDLPRFSSADGAISTRVASGRTLNALAPHIDTLIGGSADLATSNETTLKGYANLGIEGWSGRNINFGVREHAMCGILNGMAVHGGYNGNQTVVFSANVGSGPVFIRVN